MNEDEIIKAIVGEHQKEFVERVWEQMETTKLKQTRESMEISKMKEMERQFLYRKKQEALQEYLEHMLGRFEKMIKEFRYTNMLKKLEKLPTHKK